MSSTARHVLPLAAALCAALPLPGQDPDQEPQAPTGQQSGESTSGTPVDVDELRRQVERLRRELATYRAWQADGGIATLLDRAFAARQLRARVADAGESTLPITGRTRAHQLRADELETLSDDAILVVGTGGEVILGSTLAALTEYLRSCPREEPPLERDRFAVLSLLRGALARDMFAPSTAAARKLAKQVFDRAMAGEPFEALAAQHSRGPGAADGGDLGWVDRPSSLDPAIEAAVFGLGDGDTGKPIATELGFAIVRVTGIRPADADAGTGERRKARLILIPYADELDEVRQAAQQVETGRALVKYRNNEILPLLPPPYR